LGTFTLTKLQRPSPDIGEHTGEVLREFGIDDARVVKLKEKGVVFGDDL